MATSTINVDPAAFWDRTNRIYASWRESSPNWNDPDAIVLTFGDNDEEIAYTKTTALQVWLFGCELWQTVMVFCKDALYILTSPTKAKVLQPTASYTEGEKAVPLTILTYTKDELESKEASENFKRLVAAIASEGKKIGVLAREKPKGKLADGWEKQLTEFERKDATGGFSFLLAQKDEREIRNIRAAGVFALHVLKKLVGEHIEKFLDAGETVSHSSIAAEADKFFEQPSIISAKLDANQIDSCYAPMIQSGGKYDVKPGTANTDDALHAGTIIISLGARFKYYCSNLARTLFVNPTTEHRAAYTLLLDTQQAILKAMRPGVPIKVAYNTATQFIESKRPDLLPKFGKNCGFGLGIEFQELGFILSGRNESLIRENMVFNLSLSFSNLETESSDPRKKIYSVLLSDTIQVKADDTVLLTDKAQKKYEYELAEVEDKSSKRDAMDVDAAEEDEKDGKKEVKREKQEKEVKREKRDVSALSKNALSKDEILNMPRFRDSTADKVEEKEKLKMNEEKRKKHQQQLEEKQREEAMKRFLKSGPLKGDDSKSAGPASISYKSVADLPKDVPRNKLYIDAQRETILAPIYGYLVPFHVSTIKNASKTDENALRINFSVPEKFTRNVQQGKGEGNTHLVQACIKEFTYRCPDEKNLNHCLRMIKELQKRIKERQTTKEVTADLSNQEKLVLSKGRNPRLNDTFVRPSATGRKTMGVLEAHTNGFRFSASKGESIDIIYKNIKHAFYQPAEKDVIVLVHFNLHSPIMVGKKKTQDIQFCTEVMEASQSLDSRSKYDPDEIEDEQRERANRNRLNSEYQTFVRKVEEFIPNNAVEFDIPYKDLAFFGVPSRSSILLVPTVNCLVHLSTAPVFVLRLSDVEIAYFERVQFSLRNFDCVFIFKDYSRPVCHINNIPIESLDTIKEWLNSADILYFSGTQSLNWVNIMKTIQDDPKKFYDDGGWKFLSPDSDDEGSDDSEPESDFAPEDEEEYGSAGSEEEEYGSAGGDSGSDESDFSEDDDDDDEGMDWDEMEEKALEDDKRLAVERGKRGREYSDDEGDRPSKKSKPTSSSSKPSSSSSKPASSSKPSSTSKSPSSSSTKPGSGSSSSSKPSSSKPVPSSKPTSSSTSKPPSSSGSKPPSSSGSKPAPSVQSKLSQFAKPGSSSSAKK